MPKIIYFRDGDSFASFRNYYLGDFNAPQNATSALCMQSTWDTGSDPCSFSHHKATIKLCATDERAKDVANLAVVLRTPQNDYTLCLKPLEFCLKT